MPSSRSTGSKPVTTSGTPKSRAIGSYSRHPWIAQTCPGARNPCTRFPGETRIAMIAGGTRTWATSNAKLVTPRRLACITAIALAGAVVSKPTAKNTTVFSGLRRATSRASRGE